MEKNGKKYNQITLDERKVIEKLLRSNTPKRQIARLLNRSITTIRKEIKRGTVEQRTEVKTTSKRADIPLYNQTMCISLKQHKMTTKKTERTVAANAKQYSVQNFLHISKSK